MGNDLAMFVLQAALGIIMLFFGFILNGLRTSVDRVSTELKELNNAVLGKYITREESDARWKDQRALDHNQNTMMQQCLVDIASITGKPYVGPK